MISSWVVRVGLARDDGVSLGDDVIRKLASLLTLNGVHPLLTPGVSGNVIVQMTVEATSETTARSAAERAVGERAHEVWATLALPPFTITFVDAKQVTTPTR
jgi:hypothetical protein